MDVDPSFVRIQHNKKKRNHRNNIFDQRFKVVKKLAKGSFGLCYEAVDMLHNNAPVICKLNNEQDMNELEGEVLKKLNDKGYKHFP